MKYFAHILFLALLVIFAGGNKAVAQRYAELSDIRTQFYEGKIDINTAISEQIGLLTSERERPGTIDDAHQFSKCVTPVISMIRSHDQELSVKTKALVAKTFGTKAKTTQQTYLSASGKFTIHFDTTGTDAVLLADANSNGVPDYVEWTAEAADSSYNHEIITLGFPDPIPNGQTYHIYLEDLDSIGAYGYTDDTPSPTTTIYVENDFVGFPPNTDPEGDQRGALKVTVAHEFKHAIQYVQNNWFGDSDRWAEMDATLMEEVVYDNVNDYYNYIVDFSSDLFSSADLTLSAGSYEDITFALYFHERFGQSFWTDVWEKVESNGSLKFLDAVAQTLPDYGSNFHSAMLEAYMWHFASGETFSDATFGFDESAYYPSPVIKDTFTDFLPVAEDTTVIRATSAQYYLLNPGIESDGYFKFGFSASSPDVEAGLLVYDKVTHLISPYYITAPVPNNWADYDFEWKFSDTDVVGLVIVNTNANSSEKFAFTYTDYFINSNDTIEIGKRIKLSQNYPNPFNPTTTIGIEMISPQQVSLAVYDYMGRKVMSLFNGTLNRGYHNFFVDGSRLASGTYFYRLISEEGVFTKKMMLIK